MIAAAVVALVVATVAAATTLRRSRVPAGRIAPYRAGGDGTASGAGAAWVPAAERFRRDARTSDAGLARRLRDAGLDPDATAAFRARRAAHTGTFAAAGVGLGGLAARSAIAMLVLAAAGAAVGATRAPARLARLTEERRARMRLELATIDQVLAIHVRAGAGPVQAVSRVAERAQGVVADELRGVLRGIRAGRSEAEAFRHAAGTTAEPHAARTYRLFALAAEQGADLGTALRALSEDLRDVRRDELRRQATRRRAAMLVPTIAVLAPVMLLFVIAPLPSIVLGGR